MSKNFPETKFPEKRIWRIEKNSDHPERIVYIYEALKKIPINPDFTILDLACGHATVTNGLIRLWPESRATIVDVIEYDHWIELPKRRTMKICGPLQDFINEWYFEDNQFDIVMMLNSFRLWDNGRMRTAARNKFLEWLPNHAKYFITSGANLDYEQLDINGNDYADVPLQLYKIK